MRGWVPEPAKAKELCADENQIAVVEPLRMIDEDPRSVARSQVAQMQPSVAHVQPRVERRHERVVGKADVRVASSHDCFAAFEVVDLDDVARFADQREPRSRVSARKAERFGAARLRRVGGHALLEVIATARTKEVDALCIRGSALRAAGLLDGFHDAGSTVRAERQTRVDRLCATQTTLARLGLARLRRGL